MKLIQPSPIISSIKSEITEFIYVDVGCGYNGIDAPLHEFEDKLVAYGFDSNITECNRLSNQNDNAKIHYVAGVVKLDPLHPFAVARNNRSYWTHNPWEHLAVAHSLESIHPEKLSDEELNNYNLWSSVRDKPAAEVIYLDKYLPAQGINEIDLCKIDIDGPDFEVLHIWDQEQSDAFEYDLSWYFPESSMEIKNDINQTIHTAAAAWQYAAVGILNYSDQLQQKAGVIRVELSVEEGSIGIGFLGSDESNFIKRMQIYPSIKPFELFFEFENIYDLKKIIIQTWDKPKSARVKLLDFEIRTTSNQ
jgi:hypothetical protein